MSAELFRELNKNPKVQSENTVGLLTKIAENILNDPNNAKFRTLNKSNKKVFEQILQVKGGLLCLRLMGFKETEKGFVLPPDTNLSAMKNIKELLSVWKDSEEADIGTVKPVELPPMVPLYKDHPFLHRIEQTFHICLRYANKDLLKRAKRVIPVTVLGKNAQERLRAIQEHVKKNKLPEPDVSLQDLLLLELLQWFNEEFFTWVDSPDCEKCQGSSQFSHMSQDKSHFIYTNRVEMHKCKSCGFLTPFPRYEDLNILLETRRGRCGEWANVFTLLCSAMDWDSRYVLDENDHVWTEVYSFAKKRWLHCDPCENICDKPLIYETGWKKNMSYVMAYSPDEVQDVTWRYSCKHKEVLSRRRLCDEHLLATALTNLRSKRQEGMSEPRKQFLTKRLLFELVELMVERKPEDGESKGRQSGDALWRLTRGETQETPQFIWEIDVDALEDNAATVRYSSAKDVYELVSCNKVKKSVKKWNLGCFEFSNIMRKEEKDWKQVYLARTENSMAASIAWKFQFSAPLDNVSLHLHHVTFESGTVRARIVSDDATEDIPNDGKLFSEKFQDRKFVIVTAQLEGGKGDVAWQHTQLFRQLVDSEEYPFSITFKFK
ncbi:peptide-N(4)-(N-acetyl-beta-glucosaminyl)asparagine amidase [Anthonomus grandis grandis]|uniref:peptide-N(4)-(N-acetyl-beta- glucosaminyl)asparagine amidase n=1 Tax=Anthonomus grandis grandis TaxID=2921223 RepID=UPI0021651AE2|nr:peptide-N(4)-(N-acetyl-beta-glucosaminyl)asparagine amidase [Anthonomus grandis grandis]